MSETTQTLITLEPEQTPDACVIWLHGLGASGHDFEPIVPYLQLPDDLQVRFLFPHAAQQPVTVNGGMVMPAWYDILEMNVGRKVDEQGLIRSSERISQLVDAQVAAGIPAERIVLIGFSQGGAVAYHTALCYPQPLAGVAGLSTYLATAEQVAEQRTAANARIPVWIAHGTADPVVSLSLGQEAKDRLEQLGYQPQWQEYPMAHEVCLEEIQALGIWLTDRFS